MLTLINPPGLKTFSGLNMHTPNPPLGLAYVAGEARKSGFDLSVIDATGEDLDRIKPYKARGDLMVQGLSVAEIVSRLHPSTDIVGIACTFSTFWPLAREVIGVIREARPEIHIILGGEHGTAVPESVLRSSQVDIVVLGEGEDTFVQLLHALSTHTPISSIKGIAFIDNGTFWSTGLSVRSRAIDEIALPAWDLFPLENYIDRHQINGMNIGRSMPLLATRGCPYQCTFCSSPQMWTTRYIPRDPILVADEIQHYMERYNVTNFDFQDLTAVVKRSWVIKFCNELIRRDLSITWQMPSGTRSEVMDEEVLDLLYRSGCRALAFAPESGSLKILGEVKKRVDLEHIEQAVSLAVQRRLKVSCFFVIGFPSETPFTLKQTGRFIRKMAKIGAHDISVSKFIPYPGSKLFLDLQRSGRIELNDKFFISPIDFYNRDAESYSEHVSARRLYWTMIIMYSSFYLTSFMFYPFRTLRTIYHAIFFQVEEARFAKWLVDRLYVRQKWKLRSSKSAL